MPFDATDLATVKAWMAETGQGTDIDAQLNLLIPAVSRAIEGPQLMNRPLEKIARTEKQRFPKLRTRTLFLKVGPVDEGQAVTVKVDPRADFANATALVAGTDFVLDPGSALVHFCSPCLGPTFAEVTYTAGLAADLPELVTNYPGIAQAATLWVVELFRRREYLTTTSESIAGGGGVQFTKALGHAPEAVRGLLNDFRWRTPGGR